jgi:hypothetical protein
MGPSMQQPVFNDLGQFVAAVRECCAGRKPWLVVIDGFTGSGKSDLGRRLSAALGEIHVEVDDFLNEHQLV